jgi:hypothetical protein
MQLRVKKKAPRKASRKKKQQPVVIAGVDSDSGVVDFTMNRGKRRSQKKKKPRMQSCTTP